MGKWEGLTQNLLIFLKPLNNKKEVSVFLYHIFVNQTLTMILSIFVFN